MVTTILSAFLNRTDSRALSKMDLRGFMGNVISGAYGP